VIEETIMKEKKEVKTVGIGFAEALTLLFIGLKLGKVISWSWLWVLSPLWISFVLLLVIAIIIVILTD
jgi:Transmembrane Fragile-X-F protein.